MGPPPPPPPPLPQVRNSSTAPRGCGSRLGLPKISESNVVGKSVLQIPDDASRPLCNEVGKTIVDRSGGILWSWTQVYPLWPDDSPVTPRPPVRGVWDLKKKEGPLIVRCKQSGCDSQDEVVLIDGRSQCDRKKKQPQGREMVDRRSWRLSGTSSRRCQFPKDAIKQGQEGRD